MLIKLVALILILGVHSSYAQNKTWVEKLKQDLLNGYDKLVRPTEQSNTTDLEIGLTLTNVRVHEEKSYMSTYGWIKFQWQDENLKWDPKDYNGIEHVHILSTELWQPDMELYNGAHGQNKYGVTNCIVYNNGKVLFVPPVELKTFCDLDLKYWPFDTQKCNIILGSWTYSELALNVTATNAELLPVTKSNEWETKLVTVDRNVRYYACCVEPYVDIRYNVTISRKPNMYKEVVAAPALVIILLILTGFWIPTKYGEKIVLNGFTAVITSIFLIHFIQKLPAIATTTPLIVTFYTKSLILISISIIISAFVINMKRSNHKRSLPAAFRWLLNSILSPLLCIRSSSVKNKNNELHDSEKPSAIQNEWIDFATAIDRVAFIAYLLNVIAILICNMKFFL